MPIASQLRSATRRSGWWSRVPSSAPAATGSWRKATPDAIVGHAHPSRRGLGRAPSGEPRPATPRGGSTPTRLSATWSTRTGTCAGTWTTDEVVDQTIVDLPAVTLTVETGDVPADLVVTGLHRRAWHRRHRRVGRRLRDPAASRRASRCSARCDRSDLADATIPLTAGIDDGLRALLAEHRGREHARRPRPGRRRADRRTPAGAAAAAGAPAGEPGPRRAALTCLPPDRHAPRRALRGQRAHDPAGTVGDARHRPQAGGPAHPAAGGRAGDRGARRRRPGGDRRRSSATPTRPT